MTQQLEFVWDLKISTEASPELSQISRSADSERSEAGVEGVAKIPDARSVESQGLKLGQPQRVQQLELALQQCQIYIDELKAQLIHQSFLEAQLAATEEFSHIQKQAIETLKQQLVVQSSQQTEYEQLQLEKVALEDHLAQLQGLQLQQVAEIKSLQQISQEQQQGLQERQSDLERLVSQVEISQQSAVQETQQRILAQKTVERLRSQLRDCEVTIQKLETQLKHTQQIVTSQEEILVSLNQSQSDSQKNKVIQGLSASLLKAQSKVAALEAELSNHSLLQVQFHHSTQELEAQAKLNQARVGELEQQVADMQEQILHQAQAASEYETAIQHWKDRCLQTETAMGEMRELLEQVLVEQQDGSSPVTSQWMGAIADLLQATAPPDLNFPPQNLKLDLPSIMHRWRNAKI
ncbi:hypothetical protein GS597_11970 [Synechococcales cyanobacterium C]|uniref:Uncharacterized protein n=1 Tax=Petrachloros mirabilis ULC683 TaxID=2781853 RepID=A0A8K2A077_9CYAN|nr:hypothetical protein [Petrachloros mirabilis]NCJ07208.1 hypothetical protein [Petrachloros mirabilis ULC683]